MWVKRGSRTHLGQGGLDALPEEPTRMQARGLWGVSRGCARARRGTVDIRSRRGVRRKKQNKENSAENPLLLSLLEGFWEEVALTLDLEV